MADDTLAKNHERIWLEPLCSTEERCWSTEAHDCEDEGCHLPAIEYVRADLVRGHADMLAALKAGLRRLDNRRPPGFASLRHWASDTIDNPGSSAQAAADAEATLAMIAAVEKAEPGS